MIARELPIMAALAYCDFVGAQQLVAHHGDRVAALLAGECGLENASQTIDRLATDPSVGKVLVHPSLR